MEMEIFYGGIQFQESKGRANMTDDDQKQGNTSQEQVAPSPKATDREAAEEIQKTEKIRKIWKRVRKSPTFYGSVLYGWVCLIGMLYARSYYQPFGVDIFDFAEPFDFLLIAISKASIVLDIGISTVFVGICFGLCLCSDYYYSDFFVDCSIHYI